jgi:hypothetical protein
MNVNEMEGEEVDWIYLAQDRDQFQVWMNLWVS